MSLDINRIRLPEQIGEPISHYTDGVVFGNVLWVSGMMPCDVQGNVVSPGDVVAQTEQVFQNIKAVLDAAGATFENVVKVTVYLTNVDDRVAVNKVRQKYFGVHRPASTLFEIPRLAKPGAMVEIEAVAYLGQK